MTNKTTCVCVNESFYPILASMSTRNLLVFCLGVHPWGCLRVMELPALGPGPSSSWAFRMILRQFRDIRELRYLAFPVDYFG